MSMIAPLPACAPIDEKGVGEESLHLSTEIISCHWMKNSADHGVMNDLYRELSLMEVWIYDLHMRTTLPHLIMSQPSRMDTRVDAEKFHDIIYQCGRICSHKAGCIDMDMDNPNFIIQMMKLARDKELSSLLNLYMNLHNNHPFDEIVKLARSCVESGQLDVDSQVVNQMVHQGVVTMMFKQVVDSQFYSEVYHPLKNNYPMFSRVVKSRRINHVSALSAQMWKDASFIFPMTIRRIEDKIILTQSRNWRVMVNIIDMMGLLTITLLPLSVLVMSDDYGNHSIELIFLLVLVISILLRLLASRRFVTLQARTHGPAVTDESEIRSG